MKATMFRTALLAMTLSALPAAAQEATAPPPAAMPQAQAPSAALALYERVAPSLVAVQFTYDGEIGRRDLVSAGVVIGSEGLVMSTMGIFSPAIPDEQMTDFKIIVPRQDADHLELDAEFMGRDERTGLAFLRTKEPQNWPAIEFVDQPVQPGDRVRSVGLLGEAAGYRAHLTEGIVAAVLRGAVPTVVVMSGSLAGSAAPVFNEQGQAIGFVNSQPEQSPLLNDDKQVLQQITSPPHFFVPASDFLFSLSDLPTPGKPQALPWMGVVQLTGLEKDVAEFFGLENQPAVEIGDVVPDGPADKAGLRRGDKIIRVNGQPLERGDRPEELPSILGRQIRRMKPGDVVTFTVLNERDQPTRDVEITLEEQPMRSNLAKRFFAEDLGFSARELVFNDLYARKLERDFQGVLVSFVKPQGSAHSGGLQLNDLITEINGTAVTSVEQFQQEYETLRRQRASEPIKLVVLRQGNTQVIRIEPPQ